MGRSGGVNGRGAAGLAEHSVLQHGEKLLEVREAHSLHDVAHLDGFLQPAFHLHAAGFILKEKVFARTLIGDDALDVDTFAEFRLVPILSQPVQ